MSTPIIIILPSGDAVRADAITAVREAAGHLYVRCDGDVYLGGSFATCELATCELANAARDGVIEQWQAALASAPVPAPTPAAPGYARACAIVDEWADGEDVDSVALVKGLLAVLGGGS